MHRNTNWIRIITALVGALASMAAPGIAQPVPNWQAPFATAAPNVTISLVPSHTSVRAGQRFHVAVVMDIREGLWLYSPTPRGAFTPRPLEILATGNAWRIEPTLYPQPQWHTLEVAGVTDSNLVYEGRAVAYIPIAAPESAAGGPGRIEVTLTGQTCDTRGCYDIDLQAATTVEMGPVATPAAPSTYPAPPEGLAADDDWDRQLGPAPASTAAAKAAAAPPGAALTTWVALVLALATGAALNVMPCVLPVIPIKIMSLLQQARESRRRAVTLGLSYALGVWLFFLVTGGISMAARLTTGAVFNLNDPFKIPAFLIAMTLLLVGAACWLFDVFTIAVGGRVGGGASREGHTGSVGMGFFTAVLATPCSGAVLAAVFGWAQGRPAWASGAVFAVMGLGMATPHAALACFPGLLAKLPKPGVWMERLKQGMAFILLLVAAWLISTLGDITWAGWVTAYAVVFAACLWMAGTWVNFATTPRKRRIIRTVATIIAVIGAVWMLPRPAPSAIAWRSFDEGAINTARAEGEVVLVKFTADTCTLCKILDLKVYKRESTAEALDDRGVIPFLGDTTQRDYPANIMLTEHFGEPGPPVTIIYGPAIAEPIRLHGVFSADELLAAVDRAGDR